MKTIGLAIMLASCASAYAQTYKCTDRNGVTHYSDQPPTQCKATAVKIRQAPAALAEKTPPRPAAGKMAEISRQCARDMREYSRLRRSDDAAQDRVEQLREQLRGCS
jgi:hypothetical protein